MSSMKFFRGLLILVFFFVPFFAIADEENCNLYDQVEQLAELRLDKKMKKVIESKFEPCKSEAIYFSDLGDIYLFNLQHSKAELNYFKAYQIDERYGFKLARFYIDRSYIDNDIELLFKSEKILTPLVDRYKDDADGWLYLGMTYFHIGELDKAKESLSQSNLISESAEANKYLVYVSYEEKCTDCILFYAQKAMDLDRSVLSDSNLMFISAKAFLSKGMNAEAEMVLDLLVQNNKSALKDIRYKKLSDEAEKNKKK